MAKCECRRIISFLTLAVLIAGGCASPEGEGFSVYLLREDIPVSRMPIVSHIEITDKPLVSAKDIVSYTKQNHEIELTTDASERLSRLEVPGNGKVFVACVDRSPIYWGAFWTPVSSIPFDGVTIIKPIPLGQHLAIQLGYPSTSFFTGTDPRADPRILQALDRAGKLK